MKNIKLTYMEEQVIEIFHDRHIKNKLRTTDKYQPFSTLDEIHSGICQNISFTMSKKLTKDVLESLVKKGCLEKSVDINKEEIYIYIKCPYLDLDKIN